MLARAGRFFNPEDQSRLPRRLFWTAFLIRILYMTLAHTYRFRPMEDHFQFGWEAGRIGRALATGYGYADPFANVFLAHMGPTAWLPPAYPLLVGGVFRLFGVYSNASAWVLLAINCVLSAFTAVAVREIAARCFNRSVALWSAWIWVLYPAAMQYAVRWVWEMTLTTALFTWVLVLALRMRGVGDEVEAPGTSNLEPRTSQWLLFGLLWGLIALSNSTLLIFLPVCGVWILIPALRCGRRGGSVRALAGPALAGLIFLGCIAPWAMRNWQVFHAFIPLRGNLGAEMYMGNGPDSTGLLMTSEHPHVAPDQLMQYAALGEVRYVAERGALARAYIAAHPGHFLLNIGKRIDFFWFSVPQVGESWIAESARTVNFVFISLAGLLGLGLALRRRVPAAGLFAWAIVLLPIPYYLVTVHARFRHPLEPLLCIFGVYLFQSAERKVPPDGPTTRGAVTS